MLREESALTTGSDEGKKGLEARRSGGYSPDATASCRVSPPHSPASSIHRFRRRAEFLSYTQPCTLPSLGYGSCEHRGLVDVDGDGLLDYLDAENRRVWLNEGDGFEQSDGRVFNAYYNVLSFSQGNGRLVLSFLDINGDGLKDHVIGQPDRIVAHLNSGNMGLSGWELSTVETIVILPAGDVCGRWGIGLTVENNHEDVTADTVRGLFDINGDGLPDLVDTCGYNEASNRHWRVYPNRGSRIDSNYYPWATKIEYISIDEGTEWDTVDIDGDGLPDQVAPYVPESGDGEESGIFHNQHGVWRPDCNGGACTSVTSEVELNPDGGRPDLLVEIENGIGASTSIEYLPSHYWTSLSGRGLPDQSVPFTLWAVSQIEQHDGLAGSGIPGEHTLRAEYDYAGGKFQPEAREFRGFGTVMETNAEGTTKTTFFHQDAIRKGEN